MSAHDLQDALEKEFFAGFFVSEKKWYLEKYPLGVFAGEVCGEEIMNVQFFPAIPKIPRCILKAIITYFQQDIGKEFVVQILYNKGEFFINFPHVQRSSKGSVSYAFQIPIGMLLVMTIHSHNTMPAFFSAIDDEDEKITGLYGVIGSLDMQPQICCRVSLSGSFGRAYVKDLFI